jgi:hypothetical protein
MYSANKSDKHPWTNHLRGTAVTNTMAKHTTCPITKLLINQFISIINYFYCSTVHFISLC